MRAARGPAARGAARVLDVGVSSARRGGATLRNRRGPGSAGGRVGEEGLFGVVGRVGDDVGVVGKAEGRVAELLGPVADVADVVGGPPRPNVLAGVEWLIDQRDEVGVV